MCNCTGNLTSTNFTASYPPWLSAGNLPLPSTATTLPLTAALASMKCPNCGYCSHCGRSDENKQ
jgi:hypothetical protein